MLVRNPKARILAVAPKAKCKQNWLKGGVYTIYFGQPVKDFNGQEITEFTGSGNPAETWESACMELRLI